MVKLRNSLVHLVNVVSDAPINSATKKAAEMAIVAIKRCFRVMLNAGMMETGQRKLGMLVKKGKEERKRRRAGRQVQELSRQNE